jgi:L-fuconolactonase
VPEPQDTGVVGGEEEILEPDLEIVDSHIHLWDTPDKKYLLDDLLTDCASGHRVTSTIYIEDGLGWDYENPLSQFAPLPEVRLAAEASADSRRRGRTDIAAIVGHADLRYGDEVEAVLDALTEAGEGRFVGIRHGTAWDAAPEFPVHPTQPGPGLLARSDFRQGFRHLAARGLNFDAWVYSPQLPELAELARAFPEVRIVVNHLGAPLAIGPYAGLPLDDWKRDMSELRLCPNVFVKLGGVAVPFLAGAPVTGSTGFASDGIVERWGAQIRWCVEQFGAERCMFESNFPFDRQWISYVALWNAYKRIVADASVSEKAALFGGTARAAYGLTR